MKIDDKDSLTFEEKQATVADLLFKTPEGQKFFILPVSDNEFLLEDVELKLFASYDPEGEIDHLRTEMKDTSFILLPKVKVK